MSFEAASTMLEAEENKNYLIEPLGDCGKLCRLCLGDGANFNIFEKESLIVPKIQDCCSLEISENDGLPNRICMPCINTLEMAVSFKNVCKENDQVLRKNLKMCNKPLKIESPLVKLEYESDDDYKDNLEDPFYDENVENINSIKNTLEPITVKKLHKSSKKHKSSKRKKSDALLKQKKSLKPLAPEELIDSDNLPLKIKREKKLPKLKVKKEPISKSGGLCPFCGKFFTKGTSLNYHIKKHTMTDVFTCSVCSKSFNEMRRLKEHERTHLNIRDFPCEVCGKLFSTRSCAKKHLISVHQRAKVAYCKLCNKKLATGHSLKGHMKIHTGEREFECDVCTKKFAFKCSLMVHLRCHTGEKPYTCKFCDARFAALKTIKEHERLHTGETPYLCPVCSKGFKQKSNMKSHFRNNHKGIEYVS